MRAIPLLITALLITALLMVACGSEPSKAYDGQDFAGPAYTIDMPAGWEVRNGMMGTDVAALAPMAPGDAFRSNLTVLLENVPSGTTAATYLANAEQSLSTMLNNYELIAKGTTQARAGELTTFEYHHDAGQFQLTGKSYVWFTEHGGYVITATALRDVFQQDLAAFDRAAASFDL